MVRFTKVIFEKIILLLLYRSQQTAPSYFKSCYSSRADVHSSLAHPSSAVPSTTAPPMGTHEPRVLATKNHIVVGGKCNAKCAISQLCKQIIFPIYTPSHTDGDGALMSLLSCVRLTIMVGGPREQRGRPTTTTTTTHITYASLHMNCAGKFTARRHLVKRFVGKRQPVARVFR